jgi:hypothetical protein
MAVVHADDLLLDALGRGEPAPQDDEIAALLAAWRTELDDPALDPARTDTTPADRALDLPALADLTHDGAAPDDPARNGRNLREPVEGGRAPAPVVPIDRARRRRIRLVAAAAVVAVAATGTSVAAANGTPGSPFWPITRIVNPQRADTLDAQDTIDRARRAIAEGRRDDARRLLDQVPGKIARVRDPETAARLRSQLDDLRRTLAALVSGVTGIPGALPNVTSSGGVVPNGVLPSGGPAGGAGTGAGTGTGGGTGAGSGSGTGGSGSGGAGGTGGVPVPSILPSLPLPSIVPSLPGLPK